MASVSNFRILALGAAIVLALVVESTAQGRPPMRKHTATSSGDLTLVRATKSVSGNAVSITTSGNTLKVVANGVPDHAIGSFPNRGNPHRIRAQSYSFTTKLNQRPGNARDLGLGQLFGVAVNGVPFDPGAAEFWQGSPHLGWQYEALSGAVPLGLDANYGHVQPSGAYHYHGVPVGLLQSLGWSRSAASPLIGYAADGFPIYARSQELPGAFAVTCHSGVTLAAVHARLLARWIALGRRNS